MAKSKRLTIGSILKNKDKSKSDYLQLRLKDKNGNDLVPGGKLVLTHGQTLSVETKSYQLQSARQAHADKKLSDDVLAQIEERLNKQPEWVRAEVVLVTKQED